MKLALGTAQFGLDYGITNRNGQIGLEQAQAIFDIFHTHGAITLDTAAQYGRAEEAVGLLCGTSECRIVTKLLPREASEVRPLFDAALARLRQSGIHGLLIHHSDILLAENGDDIWRELELLKKSGRVTRIGVSVYGPQELELLVSRYAMDIIQIPCSVADRRFIAWGGLPKMKREGIEIHARSALLQGLLAIHENDLPAHFAPLTATVQMLRTQAAAMRLSPAEACIAYVASQPDIDYVVVGITSTEEAIAAIKGASTHFAAPNIPYAPDLDLPVDPRLWPARH